MAILIKLVLISVLINQQKLLVNTQQVPGPDPIRDSTNDMSEIAAKILSECYSECREIVVHSYSDRTMIRNIYRNGPFIITVLSDSSKLNESPQLRLNKHLFLMTPNDVTQIMKTLTSFKSTTRWNIMVPFFILDKSNRECKNAKEMLHATWKMNVLESFFLCINSHGKLMIYTYNPYTKRAPLSWKEVKNIPNKPNGWTMYARPHNKRNICKDIKFDRTKHLDGAIIKVGIKVPHKFKLSPYKDYNDSIIPFLYGNDIDTIERMRKSLNATLIFNVGSGKILSNYLKIGICDIIFSYEFPPTTMTYPVGQFQFYIVANDKGYYTPLENMKNYFGTTTLCLNIILLIAFLIILLSEKFRKLSFAGVKILRMLINKSLYTRVDKIVLKIFLPALFLYFLTIQISFLSRSLKALTTQEPQSNVETLNDLKHPRYIAIYGDWSIQNMIVGSGLEKKFIADDDCVGKIIGNDSVVCICKLSEIRESGIIKKLHISQRPVFKMTYYYGTRNDWPLREKFDLFFKNLESTGQFMADWNDRRDRFYREAQKRNVNGWKDNFRPYSISMVQWIFLFLIGVKLSLFLWKLRTCNRNPAAMTRQVNQTE